VVEQHAFTGGGQVLEHAEVAWLDWLAKEFA
jgi:hypothetical protein